MTKTNAQTLPLIGIAGKARSGKDTLANSLEVRGYYRYRFATPLKKFAALLLEKTPSQIESMDYAEPQAALGGKTLREFLQLLGTDFGRDMIWQDIWVHQMQRGYEYLLSRVEDFSVVGVVVTDVRFENEAQWIRAQGGLLVHITRDDAGPVNPHKSESGVSFAEGDIAVVNDGSLEDLAIVASKLTGKHRQVA